ncbi:hypothetical protein EMIT0P228_20077 [Pseudomonas brassicacearum]
MGPLVKASSVAEKPVCFHWLVSESSHPEILAYVPDSIHWYFLCFDCPSHPCSISSE